METNLENKKRFYTLFIILLFAILIGRFAQLQLYEWDKYYRQSERNRVREIVTDAPRGLILDRKGEILVDNHPAYSVSVVPYEFLNSDSTLALFSEIMHLDPANLKQTIQKKKVGDFTPIRIKRQIDLQTLGHIEEFKLDLPGVLYNTESKRYYPAGIKAPHLFGYLGEITADELSKRKAQGYKLGDLIGKNGIELQYESRLRGKPGVQYVEVDAVGREIRDLPELSRQKPVPGQNIYLTIDAGIQRYLEKAMADKKGAAVVLDPRNGEVLALLSKPDYEPELFSNPLADEIWNQLAVAEGHPLYNRACQSVYPPGSTYKLVLAAAGLETGILDPERSVLCTGAYRLGRRNFDCWKKGGHGEVNLVKAIEQSCNVYFYTMSLEVGLANWSKYSRLFHFGVKTFLDLPNESSGLVPDQRYLDERYGAGGWTQGLLLNLAVGQGDLLTTPLQMSYFAMLIANEGVAYKPHLVRRFENPATGETTPARIVASRVNHISTDTYRRLKQGMYRVVNGEHGTGRAAWVSGAKVCGKTGTAQNPHGKSHAWFIGFAPLENPRVALCVLVENGGSGGAVAAPIARGVFARIFDEKSTTFAENKRGGIHN
ncbi:MAG: penicillin-binding protein 2 [bacterium]